MAGLGTVQGIARGVRALLRATKLAAGEGARARVGTTPCGAIALTAGSVLLVLPPIRLGLL